MGTNNELPEQEFINKGYGKDPYPFWLWFTLLTVFIALLWGGGSWVLTQKKTYIENSPFLQVTNRDFSLFLWQNPEYMRANVTSKTGYLTAFQYLQKVSVEPESADQIVVAPPEILFRYHTWHRLLGNEYFLRPIASQEFRHFLEYAEEWNPKYWPAAPEGYRKLVNSLNDASTLELQSLPESSLPFIVKQAFQGWKNFAMEGVLIDSIKPTVAELQQFIKDHPFYARNYWRNLVSKSHPNYLISLSKGNLEPYAVVPEQEFTAFLKVGIYNYLKSMRKE